MLRKLFRTSRGDTIVEVMVVLAVLGLALGISYATANRSLLNARQAQESSEAAGLVQSQIESLASLASDPSESIYQTGHLFCVNNSQAVQLGFTTTDPTDTGGYPPGTRDAPLSPCQRGVGGRYYLSIQYDSTSHTFTAKAIWEDVRGQGQDSATLLYRVYDQNE